MYAASVANICCLLVLSTFLQLPLCQSTQVIDLSHNLDENTLFWPTAKKFEWTERFRGWRHPGGEKIKDNFWYETSSFCMAEHLGTHLDAPVHFARGSWSVDQIPEDRLVAPVFIVDLRERVGDDGDYQITIDDIESWEKQHEKTIEPSSIIILWTGWASRWPNRQEYFGFSRQNETDMHFPGLHPEAAEWLAQEREIYGVGIDTASIDYGQSTSFLAHQVLNSQNIYVLENVNSKDLDLVETHNAILVVAPLKLVSGSGSPVRLLAIVTDKIHIERPLRSSAFQSAYSASLLTLLLLLSIRL